MAYFNHAFTKMFLGTGTTLPNTAVTPISVTTVGGFITQAGVAIGSSSTTGVALSNLPAGYFGFFSPNVSTGLLESVIYSGLSGCCPLTLASSSLLTNDKIGPFHGGYKETNKSKLINPKYIQQVYKVTTCVPQQSVITIGTAGKSAGKNIATTAAPTIGNNTYVNTTGAPLTYTNILLSGGTGNNAAATVVVSAAGLITSVTVTSPGNGYTAADVLTVAFTTSPVVVPGYLTKTGGATATTIVVSTVTYPADSEFQGGTTYADCSKQFLCGETYYLRIDVKGSPALRALNHNAYQTVAAYTGCCSGTVPTPVDSTLVMIEWAKAIVINNYLKDFVLPVVFDQAGNPWYAPGTTVDPSTGLAVPTLLTGTYAGLLQTWDHYVSAGYVASTTGGIRLFGAFVETKFGNCSFQITDFFEKEPVRIYGSLVDYNGDPCVFENLCVFNDCLGVQGMGFGEQVVRDLILAESYLQNFFHTDIRVREITQGDQILGAVNRNSLYTRYFILHSVPRFNNPTGTFDNDRYMLEIIVPEANPLVPVGNTALDTFLTTWLTSCVNCTSLVSRDCVRCSINVDGNGLVTPL